MVSIRSGLMAGFIATFVTSAIVQMKNATGTLPEVHIVKAWSALLGDPTHVAVGWIAHIVVGVVVGGIAFALLSPRLPTRLFAVKGVVFGILMWLSRKAYSRGRIWGVFLVMLGAERFFVEFIRAKDDRLFGDFTLAQVISVIVVLFGAGVLLYRKRLSKA